MSVKRDQLLKFINTTLDIDKFKDYCPNGLQVSGKEEINNIITGVTACQELIKSAIYLKADAILVHHGYFWKKENPCITGIKKQRLQLLLKHDINLLAYHLPLDVHAKFGNNAQLAKSLNWKIIENLDKTTEIGLIGQESSPLSVEEFKKKLSLNFKQYIIHLAGNNNNKINKIAWCSGAGQSLFLNAINKKVDAYITGEVSEECFHLAYETGTHFFACGHHATERLGVKSIGEFIANKFNINHQFVDIKNPI